jgi:hypothetical protein
MPAPTETTAAPTTPIEHVTEDGVARHLRAMQGRSRALRRQARGLDPVLARAYRRRAAEIQLGAWAYAARTGHPDWGMAPP